MRKAISLARPHIPIIETPGWEGRSNGLALRADAFPLKHHLVVKMLDTPVYVAFCIKMAAEGHATLSGPLCNTLTTPGGVLYVIAGGAANHAGKGSSVVLDRLRAGKSAGTPGVDDMTGNQYFNGDEAMHPGDDTPWTVAMIRTSAIWDAALLIASGRPNPNLTSEHRQWSRRKIDRSFATAANSVDYDAAVGYWIEVLLGNKPDPVVPQPDRPIEPAKPAPTPKKEDDDMYRLFYIAEDPKPPAEKRLFAGSPQGFRHVKSSDEIKFGRRLGLYPPARDGQDSFDTINWPEFMTLCELMGVDSAVAQHEMGWKL